ncbi:hypothetical protein D3C81_2145300 [compost metagenome]
MGSLKVEERRDCPEGSLLLRFNAFPDKYEASYQTLEKEWVQIGWGETHLLSTEVAGGFTGVFAAMYATSGSGQATPAYFDWFEYKPVN